MPFDTNYAPDGAIAVATATSATTILGPYDTTNFLAASLQLDGTWVGTVTWEGSNDEVSPTNWTAISGTDLAGNWRTTTTSNGIVIVPLSTRWFRIRVSAYTSGTVSGRCMFSTESLTVIPNQTVTLGAGASNIGTVTLGAGAASVGTVVLGAGSALAGAVNAAGTTSATNALLYGRVVGAASGATKASAGRLYGWTLLNTNAAARYLQLYNKATAGVPGTDTPVATIPLGASGNSNNFNDIGASHATGIAWAITTDAAGTTAGASGDIVGTLVYI